MLKNILNVIAVLLMLTGGIWFFQGVGVLPGSFMSGQMQWAVNGLIAIVLGGAWLFWRNRRKS